MGELFELAVASRVALELPPKHELDVPGLRGRAPPTTLLTSHLRCNKLDHGISRERAVLEESDLLGRMQGGNLSRFT